MIRNREAASIQLTAEQLIYDAKAQFSGAGSSDELLASQRDEQWKIRDRGELNDFLQRKRKDYEDRIRKDRKSSRAYLDYAKFEAKQNDFRRSRSIFERALTTTLSGNALVWLAYAEMEAKAGFVLHSVNVLHRAVNILPRENKLWFQYALYQESLEGETTVDLTRQVFERWMRWLPPTNEPWFAYAAFEERHGQHDRARDVYERFCGQHALAKAYIRYAKWEEQHGLVDNARRVLERAIGANSTEEEVPSELPPGELQKADVWLAFAQFEARQGEPERARAIYKFALDDDQAMDAQERARLFAAFASFEKRLTVTTSTEDESTSTPSAEAIVMLRRRNDYHAVLAKNAHDYDAWLDLCRLEQDSSNSNNNVERIRDTFAQAESHAPQEKEKRFWRRYVYLFIHHALFEELKMKDLAKGEAVYQHALSVVPHKLFTFAKLWILAAQLQLRRGNLAQARKLLGTSIGMCPKDKTFRTYIQLELQLGQVERCRILYEKYLCWAPTNSRAWAKYAEMESNVGEAKRARTLFELGVSQPVLDEPDKLWLRYIDFEMGREEEDEDEKGDEERTTPRERANALYLRLVDRTEGQAARVWIAYAKFLQQQTGGNEGGAEEARQALERAEESCRPVPDQRALICRARVDMEAEIAPDSSEHQNAVRRLPTRVATAAAAAATDGDEEEQAAEWLFPRDVEERAKQDAANEATKKSQAALRLMELAQQHKKQKLLQQQQG